MQTLDSLEAWQEDLDDETEAEEFPPTVSPFLMIGQRLERLRRCIGELLKRPEHAHDANYRERCEQALIARAQIAADEMNQALEDWWPGCAAIARPN